MRHFLSGIAIVASMLVAQIAPAVAQNPFEPIIYINDSVVTRYELNQRISFMSVLGAQNTSEQAAREALIDDRLRMQAARELGIEVTDEGLQAGLEEFASRGGMTAAQFTAALERAGVEPQSFRDFVRAGVAWRGVIRQRLLGQVTVSDAEVERALTRIIETPIVTNVLLSEIIIPAPEGEEQAAKARADAIVASKPTESQFAAAARQYSASGSAAQGGRLNWLPVDNMPPTLRPIILALQPGQTTQALQVQGAVIVFLLRDTRGTLRPGAREQVLDYLTLPFATPGEAASVAALSRTCDDLYQQVGPTLAPMVQRQTVAQNAIPALIATQLASMDDNEAAVVNYGGRADLVMLCSREPVLLAEMQKPVATTAAPEDGVEAAVPDAQGIPDREMMREQLFNQKATALADAYLAELRADALIRVPRQ